MTDTKKTNAILSAEEEQAPPTTTKEQPKQSKRAKQIYDKAEKVLAQVDKASVFTKLENREFPIFELEEIAFGPELGTGGFSRVYEVTSVNFKNITATTENGTNVDGTKRNEKDENKQDGKQQQNEKNDDILLIQMMMNKKGGTNENDKDSAPAYDDHYNIASARETIAEKCFRNGSGARYAVKKLKVELDELGRARGALDLAIEIKYYSVLWHPNIVKMRGISNTPRVSTETFLLMDRLYGTLESRFQEWEQLDAMARVNGGGCCGGKGRADPNDPTVRDLLQKRLLVVYDLTCAFHYIHGAKLVYRDIKPENVGFDIRGDVKVFDFGLCRSLDEADKNKDPNLHRGYGYKLTAATGSLPYMAPEVALGQPYGKEADIFSFAIMLWEILSLSLAFKGYTVRDFFEKVVKLNQRLPIPKNDASWPTMMRSIVKEAWNEKPEKRPDMKRIGTIIRAKLNELSDDAAILNRTSHMLNRSRHSFKIAFGGSSRGSSRRGKMGGDGAEGSMKSLSRRFSGSSEMKRSKKGVSSVHGDDLLKEAAK